MAKMLGSLSTLKKVPTSLRKPPPPIVGSVLEGSRFLGLLP